MTPSRIPLNLPNNFISQFSALKGRISDLFRSNKVKNYHIESCLFFLHSTATVFIYAMAGFILTLKQVFGDPIECMSSQKEVSHATLQHYCWLEATFSLWDEDSKARGYPGLGPQTSTSRAVRHRYYTWVYFILIFQGALFYSVKYIWKRREKGQLNSLIDRLYKKHILTINEWDKDKLVQEVSDTMLAGRNYFWTYICTEIVYFLHLLIEIWLTDIILGGSFLTLGKDWIHYNHYTDGELANDPLVRIFPRMTKCTYHKYGFSGTLETLDVLCFLPLNAVNEKIFTIIWFWFIILIFISFFIMILRLLLIFPYFRYKFIINYAPSANKFHLKSLSKDIGYWFVLYNIASCLFASHFQDLIDELYVIHFDNGCHMYVSSYRINKREGKNLIGKVDKEEPKAPLPGFIPSIVDNCTAPLLDNNTTCEDWGMEQTNNYSDQNQYSGGYNDNNDCYNSGGDGDGVMAPLSNWEPPNEDIDWDIS